MTIGSSGELIAEPKRLAMVIGYRQWKMTGNGTSYNRAYLASCLWHFAQIPRYARNFRYAQNVSRSLWARRGKE